MNEFIEQSIKMLNEQYSQEQIREECWRYCLHEYNGVLRLEAIIYKSMELYAEIIKRIENQTKTMRDLTDLSQILENPEIVHKERNYRDLKENIEVATSCQYLAERINLALEYIENGVSLDYIKGVLNGELI